jgi:hypothetical protein
MPRKDALRDARNDSPPQSRASCSVEELISLTVEGGTYSGTDFFPLFNPNTNHYEVVYHATNKVIITAVTNPDTPGVWKKLIWKKPQGEKVGGDADRKRRFNKDRLGSYIVSASLAGSSQNVVIHVLPRLAGITVGNPANQTSPGNWKAKVDKDTRVTITATTDPNTAEAKNKVKWTWVHLVGGADAVTGHPEQRDIYRTGETTAEAYIGDSVIEQKQKAKVQLCNWPILEIYEITFAGNHIIEKDTQGNFAAPEWISGRAANQQSPVCYTRNNQIQISARFKVTNRPTENEGLEIRGTATFGAANLTWTDNTPTATTGGNYLTPPTMTSDNPIPDQVDFYDPLVITWEYKLNDDPTNTWKAAGTSSHVIYATLNNPVGGAAMYWTLIDVSCRNANGQATDAGVIANVFAPFGLRNIVRKRDNVQLSYWNPGTTRATNTAEMLRHRQGSGQCGAWAEFLVDMYKVHGINTGQKIYVANYSYLISKGIVVGVAPTAANTYGFLVKNWNFNLPPASDGTALTHDLNTECVTAPGIPGQNNANPPPKFVNHFIVWSTTTNEYFDPSYGAGPFNNRGAWEAAAIDGLFNHASPLRAGYDTSHALAPGTLLAFVNLVTNAVTGVNYP